MELPEDFEKVLSSVKNKRATFLIDTIKEKGFCSTEDLKNAGYEHAPRAARDVRELGIPLETSRVKDSKGKWIGEYRFGDWEKAKKRKPVSKNVRKKAAYAKIEKGIIGVLWVKM